MYEDITYEMLLQRMLARVPAKMDKREGSVIWDTHSPAASNCRSCTWSWTPSCVRPMAIPPPGTT